MAAPRSIRLLHVEDDEIQRKLLKGLLGKISDLQFQIQYATNEDEVALVIAHEIGHQAADHVATGQRNQAVGALFATPQERMERLSTACASHPRRWGAAGVAATDL